MSAASSAGAPASSTSAASPGSPGTGGAGGSSDSGTGGAGGNDAASGPAAGDAAGTSGASAAGAWASSGSTGTDRVAVPSPSSRTSIVATASPSPGPSNPSGFPAANPIGATTSSRPVPDGTGATSRPADTISTARSLSPTVPVVPPADTETPVNPAGSDTPRVLDSPDTTAIGGNNTSIMSTAGSDGQDAATAAQLSTIAIAGIVAASVTGLALFFTAILCCCLRRRRRRRRLRREKSQQLVGGPMSSHAADGSPGALTPSPILSAQLPTLQSVLTSPSLDLQSAPLPVYPGLATSPDDAWQMQHGQQHACSARGQCAPDCSAAAYGHHEVHGQNARFEAMGDTHLVHELHAHPCGTVIYELPCEPKC